MDLDKFKDVELVIDHANDSIFISKNFVSVGDIGGRTLTVQITNNGVTGALPGIAMTAVWTNKASGITDMSAFDLVDADNSIFRLTYPNHMLTAGKVEMTLQVLYNGQTTTLKTFEITVQAVNGTFSALIESQQFSALTQALNHVNDITAQLAQKPSYNEARLKSEKIELEDMSETTLGAMSGTATFNLLSVPQNCSVSSDKMFNAIPTENIFDKSNVTPDVTIADGNGDYSNPGFTTSSFIKVQPESLYKATNLYVVGYYDSNQSFLSRKVFSKDTKNQSFTTPIDTAFIRISFLSQYLDSLMLVKGDVLPSAYVPFQVSVDWLNVKNNNLANGSVTEEKFADGSVGKNKINGAVYTVNLFDKSTVSNDVTVNKDGLSSNVGYSTSDFIAVVPGSQKIAKWAYVVGFYDVNKTFISRTVNSISTMDYVFTIPSDAYYIRVSLQSINVDKQMIVDGTVLPTSYIPFGVTIPWLFLDTKNLMDESLSITKNNWHGKLWSGLGDSITNQQKWQPYVSDRFGLVYQNYGVSGTTIAGIGTNAMCTDARINAIDINAKLITVLGGTNDWVQNKALGTISDTTVDTFYGALNVMCQKLMARFPTARILLMTTPYGMYAFDGTNRVTENNLGLTTADYGEAIVKVARKFGLPCVDIYGEAGWNEYNIATYVTDDGAYLHPNDEGAKRVAEVLSGKLRQLNPVA